MTKIEGGREMREQQREDFDTIMKRVEAELRKPGGLVEQFQHQFDTLANEACSTGVELSDLDASTDSRLSDLADQMCELRECIARLENSPG